MFKLNVNSEINLDKFFDTRCYILYVFLSKKRLGITLLFFDCQGKNER